LATSIIWTADNISNLFEAKKDILNALGKITTGDITQTHETSLGILGTLPYDDFSSFVAWLMSKIQEGSLDLSQSDFDINDMVESVRALHQARADELKISLHVYLAPQLPSQLRADPYRVRQVLNNLVDNALNYNRPQGSVTLSVTPSANGLWVVFSVQDTGRGISPEMQETIFKRQQKLDNPFVLRPNEGAGLGLVLSHHLIQLMGGTLNYSTKAGEGSVFFFNLPVRSESHKPT
jgi:signal transduction histidine kinase